MLCLYQSWIQSDLPKVQTGSTQVRRQVGNQSRVVVQPMRKSCGRVRDLLVRLGWLKPKQNFVPYIILLRKKIPIMGVFRFCCWLRNNGYRFEDAYWIVLDRKYIRNPKYDN